MEQRRLGGSTLEVSAIGLGCMSMSGAYGPGDDAQSIAVVHRALDLGITFFDSSDMYGWGHNEELLGKALRGKRDAVVLATKFGNLRKPDGTPGVNGRPEYVPRACEASLKRLGVDVIDLYYQHRVDPAVPIEETVGAMARLVEQGKVRFLGLSEAAPATVRRAHAVHPIAALQIEYSLLYRVEAEETLPTLRELGISLVAYSPLGRSLLTGQVHKVADIPEDDRRRVHPRFEENGASRYIRNGVGADGGKRVVFATSYQPVSLGSFARLFRDELGIENALFFDGAISALHDGKKYLVGGAHPAGPMVLVREKAAQ